jgi:hypothetical protein
VDQGFGKKAIWGGETLPKELGTCRGIQQAYRNLSMHLDSQIWQRLKNLHKGVVRGKVCTERQREKGKQQRGEELTEMEEEGGHREELGRQRTAAGEEDRRRGGESPHTQRERNQRTEKRRESLGLGLGLGQKAFLKTHHGRTGQSTVPVWCTPDSAQEKVDLRARPVHRTVHRAVSGAHRTVRWAQTEGILKFFNFSI